MKRDFTRLDRVLEDFAKNSVAGCTCAHIVCDRHNSKATSIFVLFVLIFFAVFRGYSLVWASALMLTFSVPLGTSLVSMVHSVMRGRTGILFQA